METTIFQQQHCTVDICRCQNLEFLGKCMRTKGTKHFSRDSKFSYQQISTVSKRINQIFINNKQIQIDDPSLLLMVHSVCAIYCRRKKIPPSRHQMQLQAQTSQDRSEGHFCNQRVPFLSFARSSRPPSLLLRFASNFSLEGFKSTIAYSRAALIL